MSTVFGIKRLANYTFDEMPKQQTVGAAGIDMVACIPNSITLRYGDVAIIPLGVSVEIPKGFEGQIRPRSGLAAKYGLTILNSPGCIDSDYRGEVKAILVKSGDVLLSSDGFSTTKFAHLKINPGDRICQLVFAPVADVELVEVDELTKTDRIGGIGSTGGFGGAV